MELTKQDPEIALKNNQLLTLILSKLNEVAPLMNQP